MSLRLYSTLSRKLEEFKPSKGKTVHLYTCGPTVYDEAHIGNLRSYIFADVLRRVLAYNGYKVNWVMNITDVDDKTIKRAVDEYGKKATPKELRKYTDKYLKGFKNDLKAVNIPTGPKDITFIRVSDRIKEIKDFIKKLLKLGYAYKAGDGVYFSISKYQKKFGDYGELVGKNCLKGKKTGARVKVDEYDKENLSDFALWKARDASDGNIFWADKELGDGRPGWHIECSVINKIAFGGKPTDIHTGGVDLIFPHHTNEIAQSQPFYKPFARCWIHCEHMLVGGKKMAKRDGNFYTLKDLEKEFFSGAGNIFRFLALQTNYRAQMNFTLDAMKAAEAGLEHLSEKRFGESSGNGARNDSKSLPRLRSGHSLYERENKLEKSFGENLNDDLNTAGALGVLWDAVESEGESKQTDKMAAALGLKFTSKPKTAGIPPKIKELARRREEYRRNKQFMQADRLRKEMDSLGFIVEDTPKGPAIKPKK